MADIFLHSFTTLFVVIDPLGLLPLLLALTPGAAAADRRRMALKGTALAILILFGFAIFGEQTLTVLGIGLPAFRVAGGLMLLWIAFEMVFERRTDRRRKSAEELAHVGPPDDISVFPLAIPLLAGPGAIASVMLLMARHDDSFADQGVVLGALATVLLLTTVIFLLVEPLERAMGPTLTGVVSRLLGILLAALAVQYVLDGILNAVSAVQ
jgi:multiple antibiotic resistance protein